MKKKMEEKTDHSFVEVTDAHIVDEQSHGENVTEKQATSTPDQNQFKRSAFCSWCSGHRAKLRPVGQIGSAGLSDLARQTLVYKVKTNVHPFVSCKRDS